MGKSKYEHVTDKIIEYLEQGVRPWLQPWHGEDGGKVNKPLRHNGQPYNGINILTLWIRQMEEGYEYNQWMTKRQAEKLGGELIAEEKKNKAWVVYADNYMRIRADEETGDEIEEEIRFYQSYPVYNVEQFRNLPKEFYALIDERQLDTEERIEAAEEFLSHIPATVRHGGDKAYYTQKKDFIQLPHFNAFDDAESYYGTRLHETIHWTRHPSRLDRSFGKEKYGSEAYAMEELVAELGNAFLSADIGTEPEVREDHASYIDSWIKVLKNDKRAIFRAAALAQKAAGYIHSLQNGPKLDMNIDRDHDPDDDVDFEEHEDRSPEPDQQQIIPTYKGPGYEFF